ncbi:MAG: branched-chain amino acid ABC transporter ATP-binding protein/permease [Acetobacteraceae bacterium]|nr:branched-chain amino acid ABC transporter ATP-binding protein/permease [Acetobacteraceae bacterium]
MRDALLARRSLLAWVVFTVGVIAYPLLFPGSYLLGVGISAGTMAVSTVGLVLLLGLAHQLAIGQAAFSMVGGYASALLCTEAGWDPFLAMLLGSVVAMLFAYVIGAPILKLRGYVLAMATLALHLMLIVFALQVGFTGGPIGVTGLPKFALLGLPLGGDRAYFYTVWALALASVFIGLNIDRSRIGRALRAIAASETAAGSVGIDTARYKVQMFVVGAGMASVSGSLVVHYLRATDPTVFSFNYSVNLITATIIGGLASVWGGAVGASVIIGLRELLRALSLPLWESVIMGALTVLVLITLPSGIVGLISAGFARVVGRSQASRVSLAPFAPEALPPVETRPANGTMLEVTSALRAFGNLKAVNDVSFTVQEGSITALIGPNGAGKTTMFNLIGGYQPLGAGTVRFRGRNIEALPPRDIALLGMGRTFQNLLLFDNMTVLENVMCGAHRHARQGLLPVAFGLPAVAREEAAMRTLAADCLRFVGLRGAEALLPSSLSFGHQRLVEIARALALRPSLLLMDEPASGLNDSETELLSELVLRIAALGTTVLLVEHDMRFVMGLADHVVVMDHGEKMAEGSTDAIRNDPKVIAAYLGSEPVSEHAA